MTPFAAVSERVFRAFALGCFVLACACAPGKAVPVADRVAADETQVRDLVADVTHHIDAKRWLELRALFEAKVDTDYTSLFGGTPQSQTGDSLIEGWKGALGKVETHHQLGPVVVRLSGDSASATCKVRGMHRAAGSPGGEFWEVLGQYLFELGREPGGAWKIRKITLLSQIQTGNQKLLAEANAPR
jgi:hypothetical protein